MGPAAFPLAGGHERVPREPGGEEHHQLPHGDAGAAGARPHQPARDDAHHTGVRDARDALDGAGPVDVVSTDRVVRLLLRAGGDRPDRLPEMLAGRRLPREPTILQLWVLRVSLTAA